MWKLYLLAKSKQARLDLPKAGRMLLMLSQALMNGYTEISRPATDKWVLLVGLMMPSDM